MNNENGTTLMKSAPEDLRDAKAQIARMQGALNWYAEMAKTMQRATLHVDNQVALHILKEMALDGGKRAREALTPNAGIERRQSCADRLSSP